MLSLKKIALAGSVTVKSMNDAIRTLKKQIYPSYLYEGGIYGTIIFYVNKNRYNKDACVNIGKLLLVKRAGVWE